MFVEEIQKRLNSQLYAVGLDDSTAARFSRNAALLIGPSPKVDESFYDLPRTVRIIAKMESVTLEEALIILIEKPEVLVDVHDLKRRDNRHKPPFILNAIEDSMRATVEATGKRPKIYDGLIQYGLLADGVTQWRQIDLAFRNKGRGLENYDYKGMNDFMDAKGIENFKAPKSDARLGAVLSLADIAASGEAEKALFGKAPSVKGGLIKHGPLAEKEKWVGINMAFIRGQRGLKDSGYVNLSDFFNTCGISNHPRYLPQPDPSTPALNL